MNDERFSGDFAEALGKIRALHPPMRFGQIAVMVAGMTDDEVWGELDQAEDAFLLVAAQEYISRRSADTGEDLQGWYDRLDDEQQKIVTHLSALILDERFGPWLTRVSHELATIPYDVEDEALLRFLQTKRRHELVDQATV